MSQPSDPTPAPPVPLAMDAAAVGQLVRDELDRNNKYFEFAQGQIDKDRAFFKHLYTLAFGFIAIIVAAAGLLSYSSVSQMRADMKASVDAELERDKREINGLTDRGKDAISDAQTKTTHELENVRKEVKNRIDTEFRSDNIAALVANAAKERTAEEFTTIIRAEASTQVAKGLKDQAPEIRDIIEGQTKGAVVALEPTIKASVEKATQDQVAAVVAPIKSQMDYFNTLIHIDTLATLARSDDRKAFDYLTQIALGTKPESSNSEIAKIAVSTVSAIISEKKSGIGRFSSFRDQQTPESMKHFMLSQNPQEREAALDNYPQDDESIISLLINVIKTDDSLTVLDKAVARFNKLTKQSFDFWNTEDILTWWGQNQNSFVR